MNSKKRSQNFHTTRLLLIATHNCNYKCKYCFIQQDGLTMNEDILLRSINLLLKSSSNYVQLQYFGGEPLLLPFSLLKKSVRYFREKGEKLGKKTDVIITTNGSLIDEEKVKFFKEENIIIELSLDGDRESQRINRPQKDKTIDSYEMTIRGLPILLKYGIDTRASMVVSPFTVDKLVHNFKHLVLNLKFSKLFLMTACGYLWPKDKLLSLKKELISLAPFIIYLIKEKKFTFLNLTEWLDPLRMNTEVSVDADGTIYPACISYLIFNQKVKEKLILGNIFQENINIDTLEKDRLRNTKAMEIIFSENKIFRNLASNIEAGKIMANFVRALRKKIEKEIYGKQNKTRN